MNESNIKDAKITRRGVYELMVKVGIKNPSKSTVKEIAELLKQIRALARQGYDSASSIDYLFKGCESTKDVETRGTLKALLSNIAKLPYDVSYEPKPKSGGKKKRDTMKVGDRIRWSSTYEGTIDEVTPDHVRIIVDGHGDGAVVLPRDVTRIQGFKLEYEVIDA